MKRFVLGDGRIKLRQGDCLEVMKKIPDGSVDMILCDLPYGTTACKWDVVIPFEPLWEQYRRIAKPKAAIILFGSQPFTGILVASNPKDFRCSWIWEKSKASNFVHVRNHPLKSHEDILVFSRSPSNYYPQMEVGTPRKVTTGNNSLTGTMNNIPNPTFRRENKGTRYPRSVQYFKTAESEGKFHPTQKPVPLLEYLIKTYSNKGETVLDNTMGSGSTGVACMNLKRRFLGIEKDKKHFGTACKRIEEAYYKVTGEN